MAIVLVGKEFAQRRRIHAARSSLERQPIEIKLSGTLKDKPSGAPGPALTAGASRVFCSCL
ncbi:MAG TPA: hypothetical protein VI454_10620, partial [Verrucomicrobiae bacterium]